VVAGVLFAYSLEGVVEGLEIFWKLSSMLGIAFWLGLFWRRATTAGAWASTIAGFATWWLTTQAAVVRLLGSLPGAETLRFVWESEKGREVYLPWQILFFLSAGLLAGVIVSLVTPRVARAKLENYYALTRTPVREGETVTAPCALPVGAIVPERRLLLPAWTGLEIPVPSVRGVTGFLAGWCAVALIIGAFVFIIRG
jgi:Na+/proline symporter